MVKIIDLHTHTTCSDGFYGPYQLIDYAALKGLSVVSITDHDTIKAYTDFPELYAYAANKNIELITGIEFSTIDDNGSKYHILGYLFDIKNTELNSLITQIQHSRVLYVTEVCGLLHADGWYIDQETLLSTGDSITKAHISRSLLNNPSNKEKLLSLFDGYVPNEGELTETLLIKGKKYFVPTTHLIRPQKVIDIIHAAKGVAILAHPAFNVLKGEDISELSKRFVSMGIDGFEAINIQFDKSNGDKRIDMISEFSHIALEYSLLITGGSDYHHSNIALMGNFIELGFVGDEYVVSGKIVFLLKEYHFKKYGKV